MHCNNDQRKKVEEMLEIKLRLKRTCSVREREREEEVDLRGMSIDQRKRKKKIEWLPYERGLGFVKFQI